MMVHFMCQLDWTKECQTFGQTWFWVCASVSGVENEIHIWVSRLRNTVGPPSCGWASTNQLKAWVEEKSLDTPVIERELFLSDCPWAAVSVFSCFWTKTETSALLGCQTCQFLDWDPTINVSGSQAFRFGQELHQFPWVSNLLTADLITSASMMVWTSSL